MKSVKPGRGPSALGVWGSIVCVVVGVFWTIMAASMGAPAIFPIFGILFIITGVISGVYNYRNATGKNRYSAFDITEDGEETDPLQARFSGSRNELGEQPMHAATKNANAGFCPYCGTPAEQDYDVCRKCGKRLPE